MELCSGRMEGAVIAFSLTRIHVDPAASPTHSTWPATTEARRLFNVMNGWFHRNGWHAEENLSAIWSSLVVGVRMGPTRSGNHPFPS